MSAYKLSRSSLLILAILALAAFRTGAQGVDDLCYPFIGATTTRQTVIRRSYNNVNRVGLAPRGLTFQVERSVRYGGKCWVKSSKGWMDSKDVLMAIITPTQTLMPTPTAIPTATAIPIVATEPPGCYSENRAYVSGHMNIRASHTTSSGIVSTAKRGDVFEVSESRRGRTYCWLNIELGWMAQTSIVHGSMPLSLLPRLEGSSLFRKQISGGLNYLWQLAPHWFWYVADNVWSIGAVSASRRPIHC